MLDFQQLKAKHGLTLAFLISIKSSLKAEDIICRLGWRQCLELYQSLTQLGSFGSFGLGEKSRCLGLLLKRIFELLMGAEKNATIINASSKQLETIISTIIKASDSTGLTAQELGLIIPLLTCLKARAQSYQELHRVFRYEHYLAQNTQKALLLFLREYQQPRFPLPGKAVSQYWENFLLSKAETLEDWVCYHRQFYRMSNLANMKPDHPCIQAILSLSSNPKKCRFVIFNCHPSDDWLRDAIIDKISGTA
jgi:hypothetical protein